MTCPPTLRTQCRFAWYAPDYDASAWLSGPAELGYGDGDEATVTQSQGIFGQRITTQYFRHEFTPGDLTEFDQLTLTMLRDDGAVVYLNGAELGRTNMPDGPIDYGTFASSVSEQTIQIALEPDDLVDGVNLLAVEVHQSSAASSDISFSASLEASAADGPKVSDATEGTFILTAGDMARCNFDGDEAVAAQMAELFDTDSGVFLGLGDLVYNSGTIGEFTNCYDPTFGQFRDVTWPSPGNHEHYTSPNAAGYRQYFGAAAGPTAGPDGGLWYSFDIDDYWHVIALDSDCWGRETLPGAVGGDGCAVGSDQEQWLRADLEANQDKNILAFFHHPPFTNNQYTDHELTMPLWRALTEYGVELTLHGHEHHYERYLPLDYWGATERPGNDRVHHRLGRHLPSVQHSTAGTRVGLPWHLPARNERLRGASAVVAARWLRMEVGVDLRPGRGRQRNRWTHAADAALGDHRRCARGLF